MFQKVCGFVKKLVPLKYFLFFREGRDSGSILDFLEVQFLIFLTF